MEYEYDSQNICASRMKRKLVFFSLSHFAMPLPTVNCQLSTVNWTHTFSAKEKDTETGLSYFGSRYYSSDLSIWLSVDPMSDKYPSLSPYVYCADNPVKLVDPNGEEMTENQYKWEYNQTTGKISYIGDDGGKYHQTVEMTKNEGDNKHGKYTVDFNGSITNMFKFSFCSPTIDGIINGGLDIWNGMKTFMAGSTLGFVSEGVGAVPAAAICFIGAGQVVEGFKTIVDNFDGQISDPYVQQEIIRDVCKISVNTGAGIIRDEINKTGKTIQNSIKSITISLVFSMAKLYKLTHPTRKEGLPLGAIIKKQR